MSAPNHVVSGQKGGAADQNFAPALPAISLPKGGGAIRSLGEKFAANPVTGTGSMSVPIATSPGCSGFGLQLALSYDSGSGNGPFGFGWSLSLPQITRKTDKGPERYLDAGEESDVFIVSGAEDLVPVYRHDNDGSWVAGHPGYRARPRWILGARRCGPVGLFTMTKSTAIACPVKGRASNAGRALTARSIGDPFPKTTFLRVTARTRTSELPTLAIQAASFPD